MVDHQFEAAGSPTIGEQGANLRRIAPEKKCETGVVSTVSVRVSRNDDECREREIHRASPILHGTVVHRGGQFYVEGRFRFVTFEQDDENVTHLKQITACFA